MAEELFNSLVRRDVEVINREYVAKGQKGKTKNLIDENLKTILDEIKKEIEKIKNYCIVTHIMEMTRILSDEKKTKLSQYLKQIKKEKLRKTNPVTAHSQTDKEIDEQINKYMQQNLDLSRLRKVTKLDFKSKDFLFFSKLFSENKSLGFKYFYEQSISIAIQEAGKPNDE